MAMFIIENGKTRKPTKADRKKILEISMKVEEGRERAEKSWRKKVRKFNKMMRKKHKGRRLKCCDSCGKLFLLKVIKETEKRGEDGRGDPYLSRVLEATCPYCKNEVVLKDEYLRPLPHPALVCPDW